MAFKMKYSKEGFPYKSGFKHTGGAHEDHHQGAEKTPEEQTTLNPQQESRNTEVDYDKHVKYLNSEIERMTNYINDPKYTGSQKEGFKRNRERMQAELAKLNA